MYIFHLKLGHSFTCNSTQNKYYFLKISYIYHKQYFFALASAIIIKIVAITKEHHIFSRAKSHIKCAWRFAQSDFHFPFSVFPKTERNRSVPLRRQSAQEYLPSDQRIWVSDSGAAIPPQGRDLMLDRTVQQGSPPPIRLPQTHHRSKVLPRLRPHRARSPARHRELVRPNRRLRPAS